MQANIRKVQDLQTNITEEVPEASKTTNKKTEINIRCYNPSIQHLNSNDRFRKEVEWMKNSNLTDYGFVNKREDRRNQLSIL